MYDEKFYGVIDEGCRQSAAALVPRLLELFPDTKSVIDVGCGVGHWGKAFLELGLTDVIGIDGAYVTDPVIPFVPVDLADPVRLEQLSSLGGKFDMAVCLEVAEHLPPERADTFIDDLCALSDVVVFSAAIPGQGGTGHINEQWQSWWGRKLYDRGYWVSGDLRIQIWNDDRIENWYRQNLLVAVKRDNPAFGKGQLAGYFLDWAWTSQHVLDLVHPVLYDARRAR